MEDSFVINDKGLVSGQQIDPEDSLAVGGFGSHHPGGAQFAIGGGSVRYFSCDTDPIYLQRMAHREDGEIIGQEW